jgi:hypothetical protein
MAETSGYLDVVSWTSHSTGRTWEPFSPPGDLRPGESAWLSSDGWTMFTRSDMGSVSLVDPHASRAWGTKDQPSILAALAWADGTAGPMAP